MFKKTFSLYFILFFSLINFSFSRVKTDFLFSFLYFLFFFILFNFLRSYDLKKILPIITATSSFLIFSYGVIQKYILFPVYLNTFNSGIGNFPMPYIERIRTGRIFSLFSLPTLYSFVCSVLLILIFHYFLNSIKVKKALWGSLFLLGLFNLFLTQSFASVLYLFVGFSLYLYLSGFIKKSYIAPFIMFLSLFVFITTGTRFSEAKKLEPVKLRLSNWNQAVRIIKDYPVSGVGLGNYKNIITDYIKKDEARSIYAHNFPLQFTAENGVLLTLILLFLIIVNIKQFTKITLQSKIIFLPLLAILLLYNIIDIGIYFFSSAFIGTIILSQLYRKDENPKIFTSITLVIISILFFSIFISSQYGKGGELFLKRKLYDRALTNYRKSIKFNKFNYKSLNGLATLTLVKGDVIQAEKYLDLSLKLNPESGYSHYLKSKICQIKKKYFSALWHSFMSVGFNKENSQYMKWFKFLKINLSGFLDDNIKTKGGG